MENFKISKITIAAVNINLMVEFYENVFSINFVKKELGGFTLYQGKFGELELLLCPNEIAGVEADQSRYQPDIIVPDLDTVIDAALKFGGKIKDEIIETSQNRMASILDPDGNTLVFIQNKEIA